MRRFPLTVEGDTQRLRTLVDLDAPVERVATGFRFTEGPVWDAASGRLLFSDIPADTIYVLEGGRVRRLRRPSRYANGNALDAAGRLVTCEHGGRRVVRREPDGTLSVLADNWQGQPLNSPNDVLVAGDGSIWFTDPPFGIRPDQQMLGFSGIYRWSESGLDLLSDALPAPNGLAFSPSGDTFYVTDSREHAVHGFAVTADGALGARRWVADMTSPAKGNPDGLKVDREGNLFVTGPGGVWLFDPSGCHLGTLVLPELPANCAWGDDGRSLFVTARTSVYRLRMRTCGPKI